MIRVSIFALAATTLFACTKVNDPTPQQPIAKYGSGVLVCNEGVFQTGVGSVSLYNRESKTIQNEIYQTENAGVPLGNLLQSAAQLGNKTYFIVNNSQQIIVVNSGTLKYEATITGFQSPRFMHIVSTDKAYVTDWVSNTVAVLNLKTNTIAKTIAVGNGPENMTQIGHQLFVANSGGFGVDSTITIINAITDAIESSFAVGPNPSSLQVDVNGNLWILCSGVSDWQNPANDVAGRIVQIDRTTYTVMKSFTFPNNTDHPAKMVINKAGTELLYLSSGYSGQVFKLNISEIALPTSPFISGSFYALGVDPSNNEIYTSDPLDYNQRGSVYRYTSSASLLDSAKAGVIPGYFLFR